MNLAAIARWAPIVWHIVKPILRAAGKPLRDQWARELAGEADEPKEPPCEEPSSLPPPACA